MTATVLITGYSSGIGRATALRLVGAGHTVVATARRVETLAPLAEAGCRTLSLDVTDDEAMRSARRLLPDRGWDAFLRAQFPSPARPA